MQVFPSSYFEDVSEPSGGRQLAIWRERKRLDFKYVNLLPEFLVGGLAMALDILRLWVSMARSLEFPRTII